MAMSSLGGRNGGGSGARGRYRPLAEINVTPFVDVMLVLLIIFMVTAPLMTSGVSVDLPKTDAKPLNSDSTPLTVSIDAQGKIFLQNQKVELPALVAKLQAVAAGDANRRVFVRGDKDISYGLVVQVMATIAQGGFTKVALLAQAPVGPGATPAATTPGTVTPTGTTPATTTPAGTTPSAKTPAAPRATPGPATGKRG